MLPSSRTPPADRSQGRLAHHFRMAPGGKSKDRRRQPKGAAQIKSASQTVGQNASPVTIDLYQRLLDVFGNAFSPRFPLETSLIQQVKQHLYNREFEKAFGRREYLEAYAVRWSSSRALGYLNIFVDISAHLVRHFKGTGEAGAMESVTDGSPNELDMQDEMSQSPTSVNCVLNVICLGGGAGAEIVGLGGYLKYLQASAIPGFCLPRIEITAVDIANWSGVVHALEDNVTTALPLPKYASEKVKAANVPLVCRDDYSVTFHQCDLLGIDIHQLGSLVKDSKLITLMFTLNELYSSSIPQTTKFLLSLGSLVKRGTLLLVVDSPGSYSTVELGNSGNNSIDGAEKTGRKYPMHWLLDHTLLETSSEGKPDQQHAKWKKLVSDDSRWFRLPDGLRYPIELENMRYQIHLYELA
ncbi:hypothetical protein GP486_007977 [Trichoglossum hirsutum]|uniref:25S rRNA (Uridine(2843)-N(3))-methyltransferase n=1 Tax=Trichoglossum hirsutum TaxID=265104 RepID=A0A9P8L7D2_9PEZI|nr:hypothetical protein GP486_007977 [Trichoglossum hirsutum]